MALSPKKNHKGRRLQYKFNWKMAMALTCISFSILLIFRTYYEVNQTVIKQFESKNKCYTTSMNRLKVCPRSSTYIRYNKAPKHFIFSILVNEDASFFAHTGFDWAEIKNSFWKNVAAGRFARGGSTLTQQLAKNLYLTNEKSLTRKLKEFFITFIIEKKLSKKEIIERYINIVEFGKGIYGIHRAAEFYFSKPVADLSIIESSYLASLLPSPIKYSRTFISVGEFSPFNKKVIRRTLRRLAARNIISAEELEVALSSAEISM